MIKKSLFVALVALLISLPALAQPTRQRQQGHELLFKLVGVWQQVEEVTDSTGNAMLKSLMRNEAFRGMFIQALDDMRNRCFEKKRVEETIGAYLAAYEKPVCDTYRRFGPEDRLWGDPSEYYRMRVGELSEWLGGRYEVFDDMMARQFPE